MDINISDYLERIDIIKGICKNEKCRKEVQWARERLAAHKRARCPDISDEEKRIFRKRPNLYGESSVATQQSQSSTVENIDDKRSDIDRKIASYFYRTGISFRIVESEAFKEMIRALNPDYAKKIPTAKALSGRFLDEKYDDYTKQLNNIISNTQNLTLVSDGWTDVNSDHIVNFSLKAPNQRPFFYSSIDTSGISQTAAAVAAPIIRIIEEIGPEKFIAVVTDNAAVMKAAWKIIENKFGHISAYGCSAHCVNLLIKDLLNSSQSSDTVKDAEKVIKFFKNHHIVKAKLDAKRKAKNVNKTLSMPVSTRWLSMHTSLSSLLRLKYCMIEVLDEDGEIIKQIQPKANTAAVIDLVKSTEFWTELKTVVKQIDLPSKTINKLERDDEPLSSVYESFTKMFESFDGDLEAKKIVKKRLDFIYKTNTGLAYMLTPKYAADGYYFGNDKIDILSSATEFSERIDPEIKDSVGHEIVTYMDEMASASEKHKEMLHKMTSTNYWRLFGKEKYPNLFKIAQPISEMISSSATAERVWSIFRFIHSRLRNRLTKERVNKLVFIYINGVLLDTADKKDYFIEDDALFDDDEQNEIEMETD